MNLIEQLGGYEKAKELTDHVRGNESLHKVLARELLEYRRQHNIFEVGDKVVLKNNEQEGVLTVQMFKDDFIRAYLDDFKYSFGHQINFRHATDAEIKAGRRL